ncbi:indolepyruvate oxidoreductase subunit beta family protein [Aestuariicella hydrocarbonica]|uniref:Indolepyruvate oxidoreductase subunit beta family protein n=1 Tax=Pseudomaricurvus hydrocarbonicus TaxID=1470433 RepID=A0A9E5MQ06_9GAMM|nr:indolepyruvate oxidoreductase subunit beta family protein [Aestuariicella hydrocarbonica]NHO68383.1 indolepyruvate oxidoreductase subunit beta family protein [Aestuariicella hydrocarbonica]
MISEPIKIAVFAMGGEGGGVLADWIVSLAEKNGFYGQNTSVPGVAQRTGATIYYVEIFPIPVDLPGKLPVLGLMPTPGDVDVVLASELMEAGRAVQRGLVTDDRTSLISSSSRVYSISEKSSMADGRVDSESILLHAEKSAHKFVCFDMADVAQKSGSVISAVLFGALCGSGDLPFNRSQFEDTIRRGGVGVEPSLRAFESGYNEARSAKKETLQEDSWQPPDRESEDPVINSLLQRIYQFPVPTIHFIAEGVRRLVDYQDAKYAHLYLDRLKDIQTSFGGNDNLLIQETARHLALWMSYEDTIRVADLKTRSKRFERVHKEVGVSPQQVVWINEYMHPRMQEICETLPKAFGKWLSRPHFIHRLIARFTQKGRVVPTNTLFGYLLLCSLAFMKRWRRATLRYSMETKNIEAWLIMVKKAAAIDPALATELAKCQNLVKGYGDTHSRGLSSFRKISSLVDQLMKSISPGLVAKLRLAALADDQGNKLDDLIKKTQTSLGDFSE